jgi:iron complex transport system permease protein
MMLKQREIIVFVLLSVFLVTCAILHLFAGYFHLSIHEMYRALFHYNHANTEDIIVWELRIPRLIISILAGAGLSLAGMLMQTLFNNPLAGPYVLGINSGSSLFVACSVMTGISFFQSDAGLITSAIVGALIFGGIILAFSLVVRSHISLLLIGLMLGSFTGALISIIQTASSTEALKTYTMWTMGSLQNVKLSQIPVILLVFISGLLVCVVLVKPLNTLVLGEKATAILGLNVKRIRFMTISITALFSGVITAYCGPIAFVGLAIPNLSRHVFQTQEHGKLIITNFLLGAVFMVGSDTLLQLLERKIQLPINAFTSMIGAPLIILIVLKKIK